MSLKPPGPQRSRTPGVVTRGVLEDAMRTQRQELQEGSVNLPRSGVPSGTGFRHVTNGAEDAAAKLVETADLTDKNVTVAKIQDFLASSLVGRGDAGGTGSLERISLGTNLSMTGTTLNATSSSTPPFDSTHPDAKPASPNNADDEFDVGASLDTTGARRSGAIAWAFTNQPAGATANYANDQLLLFGGASAGAFASTVVLQAISGAFKFRAKIIPVVIPGSSSSVERIGMIVAQSSNGDFIGITMFNNSSSSNIGVGSSTGANRYLQALTSVGTNRLLGGAGGFIAPIYLEIEEDATTRFFRFSLDGRNYNLLLSHAKATTVTTDRIGLLCHRSNGSAFLVQANVDWFRRIS